MQSQTHIHKQSLTDISLGKMVACVAVGSHRILIVADGINPSIVSIRMIHNPLAQTHHRLTRVNTGLEDHIAGLASAIHAMLVLTARRSRQ